MNNSIYVALSRQVGTQNQLAIIANNLANANTTGYQSEDLVFKSFMVDDASNRKTAYANDIGTIRNTTPGTIEQTDNQLHFAIEGKAYFGVQTPQGEMYTRAGSFVIDQDGALATVEGYKVLDASGSPIEFQENDVNIVVYADGRMEVDGEERSQLGVFEFQNDKQLKKTSSNLYSASETPTQSETARVIQGALEKSNVEPIVQITNLIEVQRAFNNTNKMISDLFELQDNAVRTIARPA